MIQDERRESNVVFLRPYDEVVATWRRSVAYAYDPERLFARFSHQVETTYVNRIVPPARGKLSWSNLTGAAIMVFRCMFYLGIQADYRRPFWRAVRQMLRRGLIGDVLAMSFIARHLIEFTREALRGEQNASFYSAARKERDNRLCTQPLARIGAALRFSLKRAPPRLRVVADRLGECGNSVRLAQDRQAVAAGERLGVAAGEHHRNVGMALANNAREREAVEFAGQHHIGEHKIDWLAGDYEIERGAAGFHRMRAVVELLQQCGGHDFDIGIVLDHQDRFALAVHLLGRLAGSLRDGGGGRFDAARQIDGDRGAALTSLATATVPPDWWAKP